MNKTIYKFMETLKEHANGSELEMMDLTYNLSLNFITSEYSINERSQLFIKIIFKYLSSG